MTLTEEVEVVVALMMVTSPQVPRPSTDHVTLVAMPRQAHRLEEETVMEAETHTHQAQEVAWDTVLVHVLLEEEEVVQLGVALEDPHHPLVVGAAMGAVVGTLASSMLAMVEVHRAKEATLEEVQVVTRVPLLQILITEVAQGPPVLVAIPHALQLPPSHHDSPITLPSQAIPQVLLEEAMEEGMERTEVEGMEVPLPEEGVVVPITAHLVDLQTTVEQAIVVCLPQAPQGPWAGEEVEDLIKMTMAPQQEITEADHQEGALPIVLAATSHLPVVVPLHLVVAVLGVEEVGALSQEGVLEEGTSMALKMCQALEAVVAARVVGGTEVTCLHLMDDLLQLLMHTSLSPPSAVCILYILYVNTQ